MAISKLTLVKAIELIIAAIIFWMHYNTYEADGHLHLYIITTTFAGFLIVIFGTFLGLITGNGINRTVDLFYCAAGAALYITAGSLTINHFHNFRFDSSAKNMGLTKGSLGIIEGVIFLVDAFFVFKSE